MTLASTFLRFLETKAPQLTVFMPAVLAVISLQQPRSLYITCALLEGASFFGEFI